MKEALLDTSAYSALGRGHLGVAEVVRGADRLVLTPVVLGELLDGFRRGGRRRRNEDHLRRFLSSPRVEVVGIDADTAERYAVILEGLRKAGTPVPTHDLWIAASAMQHGLPIVTTDPHFRRIPQVLARCFEAR